MLSAFQKEQALFAAAVQYDMRILKLTKGVEYKIFTLLRAVSEGKRWVPVMQKKLAEMCGVSQNATGDAVRGLMDKGLLERRKFNNASFEFRTAPDNGQVFARDVVEARLIDMARPPVRRRTRK